MQKLIHINTGSIDDYENWQQDAKENGWSFEDALKDGSLVKVNEQEQEIAECKYCQEHKNDYMMPSHFASSSCESGKRNHCTCNTCF